MSNTGRLHTIDAMRGIAALAVVLYHVHTPAFQASGGWLIDSLHAVFNYGTLGVAMFFAISGFVIAAAMQRTLGLGGFGKFMAKRSVRLDPTYWASMALDIALTAVAIRLAMPHSDLPSVRQVLLNLLYLQDLTGVGGIVAVYWTLCIEIQFYLVFGLIMTMGGRFRRTLFIGVTLYAMLVYVDLAPSPPGLFLPHWTMFIIGAAAYYYGVVQTQRWPEFIAIAALIIITAAHGGEKGMYLLEACLAAIFFYIGARRNRLRSWLNNPALLYLGSRSYSLYLFHTIVGERAAKLAVTVIGHAAAMPSVAIGIFLFAVACSMLATEIVCRFIELPTLEFARRIFAPSSSRQAFDLAATKNQ